MGATPRDPAATIRELLRAEAAEAQVAALREALADVHDQVLNVLDLSTGWCSDKLTAEEKLTKITEYATAAHDTARAALAATAGEGER